MPAADRVRRLLLGSMLGLLGLILPAGCASHHGAKAAVETGPLVLRSAAFAAAGVIPIDYSCAGSNLAPPLSWHGGAPAGTTSWALVVQDLDVRSQTWLDWVVVNIPLATRTIESGQLPLGAAVGLASNTVRGYVGLCPPQGAVHRYRFTIYAERAPLRLGVNEPAGQELAAITAAAVTNVSLTGRFAR
ncbi:MAG: YbhB/YbcL family Raf kinase inhibitor-like protein [Jatrophihabitantaceae bacterium]